MFISRPFRFVCCRWLGNVATKPTFYVQKRKVVSADKEILSRALVTVIYSSW